MRTPKLIGATLAALGLLGIITSFAFMFSNIFPLADFNSYREENVAWMVVGLLSILILIAGAYLYSKPRDE